MMDMFEMKVMELLLEDGNIAFMLNGQICYVEFWRLMVLTIIAIVGISCIAIAIGMSISDRFNKKYINYLERHQISGCYK